MNNDGKLFYETRGGEKKEITKRPVGRPPVEPKFTSPHAAVFDLYERSPEAIQTQLVTQHQIRDDEKTIIWGLDDAEPMRILKAIADSPTATSCIGKIEAFTQGSGFADEAMMSLVINEDGKTLWDLHCAIVPYLCQLDGFTVNFKYDQRARIVDAYNMATDSCRFEAMVNTHEICALKYNPYFGTNEYEQQFTKSYGLFDLSKVNEQYKINPSKYLGQVYFHSTKRTLYKHYPVPKYWAGKKWIYADAKLATYMDTILDNGFFESVLMKMIGDPTKMSQDPSAQREVIGSDGIKRKESYKTEGQVFNEMMAKNFSGVSKAAKAMVFWSLNKDQAPTLEAFPSNISADLISTTLLENIRMISISTDVPAVLANLPNSLSSLGSGGDAVKNAVEYMQASTSGRRNTLENFYNNILLPNLQKPVKQKVKIKEFSPFTTQVMVDDKTWEFMNEAEKIEFIKKNNPSVTIIRQEAATQNTIPATVDENGNTVPAPTVPKVDEVLKGLQVSEINKILSIVKKVNSGVLTPEQAKLLLAGYGLNEEQINAFLNPQPVEL